MGGRLGLLCRLAMGKGSEAVGWRDIDEDKDEGTRAVVCNTILAQ